MHPTNDATSKTIDRRKSNWSGRWTFLAIVASIGVALLLAYLKMLQVPGIWGADAYTYIQAALQFPRGETTFIGSLVGDRHLAIWFYHLFFDLLGENLDSLSVALGVLLAINGSLITGISFLVFRSPLWAFLIASITNLLTFGSQHWFFPTTDPPFIVTMSLLLLLWVVGSKHWNWFVLISLALIAGIASSIRPGPVLFVSGMVVTVILLSSSPVLEDSEKETRTLLSFKRWLPPAVLLFPLIIGMIFGNWAWNLWVPAEKPPGYTFAYLLVDPIVGYADCENGPVSALACQVSNSTPSGPATKEDRFAWWHAVMQSTYLSYGTDRSDSIMRDVGIETLSRFPLQIGLSTLKSFGSYFLLPQPEFAIMTHNYEEQKQDVATTIREYESGEVRTCFGVLEDSPLGREFLVSLDHLPKDELAFIANLRRFTPSMRVLVILPGVLFALLLVLVPIMYRFREWDWLRQFLPFCFYFVGLIGVAAISQGFFRRYSEPFLPLTVLAIAAATPGLARNININVRNRA
ncbi:MAG: hypothetical protein U9R25_05230 [Chloroflexota bacterium]|nr:hypothetical protein [Chloroflexota bacterium]